jgi:hypothetical protein
MTADIFESAMVYRFVAMVAVGVEPLGGAGTIVEIDETYTGRQEGQPAKSGSATKNIVLTLVERGGSSRSFHIDTSIADIAPIVRANIHPETAIMTDEARHYVALGKEFASFFANLTAGTLIRNANHR